MGIRESSSQRKVPYSISNIDNIGETAINRRLLPLHLHKVTAFVKSVVVVKQKKKKLSKNNIGR